ncbi:hypothetical protein PM082_001863 [Marasmius tenuissimus]|nr:hypothetical protein PM082_001863 [Marasmius tenuissimus]
MVLCTRGQVYHAPQNEAESSSIHNVKLRPNCTLLGVLIFAEVRMWRQGCQCRLRGVTKSLLSADGQLPEPFDSLFSGNHTA